MQRHSIQKLVQIVDTKVLRDLFINDHLSRIFFITNSAKRPPFLNRIDWLMLLKFFNSVGRSDSFIVFLSVSLGMISTAFLSLFHQKHSIVQNLHNVTSGSAFLILARGILKDVGSAECFTITTDFNQIQV